MASCHGRIVIIFVLEDMNVDAKHGGNRAYLRITTPAIIGVHSLHVIIEGLIASAVLKNGGIFTVTSP